MNFFLLDKPFAIFTNACFSVDAYFQMVEASRLLAASTGGTHLILWTRMEKLCLISPSKPVLREVSRRQGYQHGNARRKTKENTSITSWGHLTWKIRFVPTVSVTQGSLNINVRGTHKQTNKKWFVQRWRRWRYWWWWWWTLEGVGWRLSISGCAHLCTTSKGEIQLSGYSHRQPQKQINLHTWDELPGYEL